MQFHTLSPFSGEFQDQAREAAFQAERLPETVRHARLLLLASAVLNALFLLSDWRFFGQPHFYVAVPARIGVVAIALICLWSISRAATFRQAQASMLAWEWINAAAVAVLVISHSNIALFVVLMLPAIYYLAVPTSFRWTVISGVGCSIMMLAGYLLPDFSDETTLGLVLAVVMLNVALIFVVSRSNRLQRTEWAATQAQRDANHQLAESRAMFETMFKTVPAPLVVVRMDGTIVSYNEAAVRFLGATMEALGIRTIDEFYVDPNDRGLFLEQLSRDGYVDSFELQVRLADGSIRTVLLSGRMLDIDGVRHIMTSVVDITERKAAEERVWRVASHDPLTNLPNRAFFQSRLEQVIAQAERSGSTVTLFLIDIDNLRSFNDTLGHDAGDALITRAAECLNFIARDRDMVARLGGDEFVIIAVDPLSLDEARALGERILSALRQPFSSAGGLLSVQASIGIASFPGHDKQPSDLLKDADLALKTAKAMGRNRVVLYAPHMRHPVEQSATAAADIQEALRQGQIVPFYQPKVDVMTGRVVGFEALARWRHPTQGLLTPGAFTAAFDDPELSIAFGEYMVRRVAEDIRLWLRQGIDCGRIAINLSTAQFSWVGLAKRFLDILQAADVPTDRLEVEITETVFLGRTAPHVVTALTQFRESGVKIALDDFGTGYASLIHLKQFPIDSIKIDRSFVQDIDADAENAAIVVAIIKLGASLGMDVVAEGVETAGQAAFLRQSGCRQAQGNLYGEPMASSQVLLFMRHHEVHCA